MAGMLDASPGTTRYQIGFNDSNQINYGNSSFFLFDMYGVTEGIATIAGQSGYWGEIKINDIGDDQKNYTSSILVGARNDDGTPGEYWQGYIQAMAIYGRLLTTAEIKALIEEMEKL
jgi:hypothetical protein